MLKYKLANDSGTFGFHKIDRGSGIVDSPYPVMEALLPPIAEALPPPTAVYLVDYL